MTTPAPVYSAVYTVSSVTQGGPDRVIVTLNSTPPSETSNPYPSQLSLNLPSTEAQSSNFYPGKRFTISIAPEV